jgi:DNA-binding XRE family transcriptional regulator
MNRGRSCAITVSISGVYEKFIHSSRHDAWVRTTPRTVQSPELQRLVSLLAAKRVKAGLSQRELSRRMGLNPTTFWQLEQGRRGLQVSELIDAARVLDEDPVELLRTCLQNGA